MKPGLKLMLAAAALSPSGGGHAVPAAPTLAVDEGRFVPIGGEDQWVTVRGRSRSNPVLLVLHGGPGFPMSFLAPLYADWEARFTIVQWDQPATGATLLKNPTDPRPLTIDRYVGDGLAVAEWARRRLGVRKVVLLGTSWGALLGLEMAHRRPDLFCAYVGAAQPVGPAGAELGYRLALEAARRRGDSAGVTALERVGPPPYRSFDDFMVRQIYSNPPGLPPTPAQAAAGAELVAAMTHVEPNAHYLAPLAPPAGYDGGFMAAQKATWRETWSWDSARLGRSFRLPLFLFQGEVDYNTPSDTARAWLEGVRAPRKAFELVPGAGHDIILFHRQLLPLLERHVRPVAGDCAPRG